MLCISTQNVLFIKMGVHKVIIVFTGVGETLKSFSFTAALLELHF